MLFKLFGQKKHGPPPGINVPLNPIHEENSSALKIIHAGGLVERYYMAVPAARIMQKHPNFILARPEVFRRPWDSVVQPEEMLIPGQKYFMVPTQTVKKLRRRIRKPIIGGNASNSFVSESSLDTVSKEDIASLSSKSFIRKSFSLKKTKAKMKPISSHFRSATGSKKGGGGGGDSVSMVKKGKSSAEGGVDKSSISSQQTNVVGKKKVRYTVTWEPSLTVIDESHSSEEC